MLYFHIIYCITASQNPQHNIGAPCWFIRPTFCADIKCWESCLRVRPANTENDDRHQARQTHQACTRSFVLTKKHINWWFLSSDSQKYSLVGIVVLPFDQTTNLKLRLYRMIVSTCSVRLRVGITNEKNMESDSS